MGTKVPKQLSDYGSFGLDLGIVCQRCGRTAVFNAYEASAYLARRNVPVALPLGALPFKCRCGSRDVISIGVEISRRPEKHTALGEQLQPLYVLPAKRR